MLDAYTFGCTPEILIHANCLEQCPNGYPMTIRSQAEWSAIAAAVNVGIDSYLEAITESTFDHESGECLVSPSDMPVLLRRLVEQGSEEGDSMRAAILSTLGIEEV